MLFEAQLLAVNEEGGETERETEGGGGGYRQFALSLTAPPSDTSHATNQKHYRTQLQRAYNYAN